MHVRIVIAPDSFKDCLSATAAAEAIAQGVRRACPEGEILMAPMADGGQGTVAAVLAAVGGDRHAHFVRGPLGEPVEASFALLADKTAVIEMAAAAGLELLPLERRNPLYTTTYGVGQLLEAAISSGARRILIGIGGSATNDGGAGLAQALGYRLLDASGDELPPGGGSLNLLARIDSSRRDQRIGSIPIDVACDVTNPLTGPSGAAAVYGPQKGADPAMVAVLDANLAHFARIVKRDLGVDVVDLPGAGAAGGLGAGLVAFANASLKRGAPLVADIIGLKAKLASAALCLTGEGKVDRSTAFGKTVAEVTEICRQASVPVIVLTGGVEPGGSAIASAGPTAIVSILQRPCSLSEAIAHAKDWLAESAAAVVSIFLVGLLRR